MREERFKPDRIVEADLAARSDRERMPSSMAWSEPDMPLPFNSVRE